VESPAETPRLFEDPEVAARLAGDLRGMLELPEEARAQLWSVLGPCLGDAISPGTEEAIDAFAQRFEVQPEGLARVLRGCRTVVRAAALVDLDGPGLARAIAALGDGLEAVTSILLLGFDAARRQIVGGIVRAALFEHGPVLEGVSWRTDHVVPSGHRALAFPLALVTLRYVNGAAIERITLQATRERLLDLKAMCDALLGEPDPR
jgi:hypothetical protein